MTHARFLRLMDRAFPDLTTIDDALLEALLFAVTFHPMAHLRH